MSLLKPVTIGTLTTRNNVFLAPLAGISERGFRIIGSSFGCGLCFTEMVSSHGLVNANRKSMELLRITRKERPTGIQIFGSNPEIMSTAASLCNDHPADLLDINGGCSVRKVMSTGAGAGILEAPWKFYKIVNACVSASIYPVSVKIRLGLSENRINVREIAEAAEEAGAELLTLHPRTAESKYSGKARWEYIGMVKDTVSIPVCGNGDIRSPEDAVRMVVDTGCDAVMIGRAAIGNPWIIRNVMKAFEVYPEKVEVKTPGVEEKVGLALDHLRMIVAYKGEKSGIKESKKIIHRYLKGVPHASKLKERFFRMNTREEMEKALESILEERQLQDVQPF
ncbi:MAG: tRNA dihydrouridine synthase DusB [Spirochaetota bacterium]